MNRKMMYEVEIALKRLRFQKGCSHFCDEVVFSRENSHLDGHRTLDWRAS